MAIFKCKMCGGTLEVQEGNGIAVCEYCGSKQTVPSGSSDSLNNLYNRANNLRLKNEFDKAETIYEKIVQQDDAQAEAHWGIVLCKYGIEYVEDPKTLERIPTCHRTVLQAVTSDADYQAAIDYSDTLQQSIYESEARAIDRLQRDILAIVKNEKPFDVFICYKETDENGKRTVDSAIANDIYYQLTSEGFKTFYAPITLEDKIGQEYEPYIFAALTSAKVMLVLGTKPEYFTAVWVRNEWSRYMNMMKQDRSKLLIPCYRDMDAYELPEEFAHLQAQDMSRIGFIQDLLRGVRKVVSSSVSTAIKVTPVADANPASGLSSSIQAFLKRAMLSLEDGEWDMADEFCERVLNQDPENPQAYLMKLMAELHVHKQDELSECEESFENRGNYKKTIRFGSEELVAELRSYIDHINGVEYEEEPETADEEFDELDEPADAEEIDTENFESVEVGDFIVLGSYLLDSGWSSGYEDVEWQVLAKDENKALLVSQSALDCRAFHETNEHVTWKDCTLRKWLNSEFINNTFGKNEQRMIVAAPASGDKIFLLSIEEIEKYLETEEDRRCVATPYARSQGAYTMGGYCWWWALSESGESGSASVVNLNGSISDYDAKVYNRFNAVRPALWIRLEPRYGIED